jgi:hypothetical protein
MVRNPDSAIYDGSLPKSLLTLPEALNEAPEPFNWVLTPAERRMNDQILKTLFGIATWRSPSYVAALIQNAITHTRMEASRDRRLRIDWEPLHFDSTIADLLVQIPIHMWPVPLCHACFHPFCDHKVDDTQNSHLQREHTRKRILNTEDIHEYRIWNGESALQAQPLT